MRLSGFFFFCYKGWYTYDVYENSPIFKIPHPLVYARPKFFHPLDLGRPISNETPLSIHLITNQLKENIIPGWLLYIINSFLQVGFRSQYQLINLVWLSFDFFSFSWSLTICFFVPLYFCVCSCPIISRNFHVFSTFFVINLFCLHNLKA